MASVSKGTIQCVFTHSVYWCEGTYNLALPTIDRKYARQKLASVRKKILQKVSAIPSLLAKKMRLFMNVFMAFPVCHFLIFSIARIYLYCMYVYCKYQKKSPIPFLWPRWLLCIVGKQPFQFPMARRRLPWCLLHPGPPKCFCSA